MLLVALSMGMILRPLRNTFPLRKRDTPLDLKPTKQHMHVRSVRYVAITPIAQHYSPEPSIEQKNIALANALLLQMALRRTRLTKDRLPSSLPGYAGGMQIWIKMNRRIRLNLPSRQVMHYLPYSMLT